MGFFRDNGLELEAGRKSNLPEAGPQRGRGNSGTNSAAAPARSS